MLNQFWKNNKTIIWTRHEKDLVKNTCSGVFYKDREYHSINNSTFLCKKTCHEKYPYTNMRIPVFRTDTGR